MYCQGIAASPYLPQQWNYADFVPSQSYYAFAQAAGCSLHQSNACGSIFQCLISKDTNILQNASALVSGSGRFETWGFLPVTDGSYIQQLPSQQLLKKQVNGEKILVGVSQHLQDHVWAAADSGIEQRQRRSPFHPFKYRD